jgi:hypothetical protein
MEAHRPSHRRVSVPDIISHVRSSVKQFCQVFLAAPYLRYTEYGRHARLYTRLCLALPAGERYTTG